MKIASFCTDFKLTLPPSGKQIKVLKNKKYIFSDFVLKTFIDNVMQKSGKKGVSEMIKSVEELERVFPVLNLAAPVEELKKINTLLIIRTGGIGDLLALSNVAKLTTHIFHDVLKNDKFKVFFITDQKYSAVFRYFEQMVTPIFYFYDPVDTVLRNHNIFGTNSVRSIFFEGLIEEREDNWFDLQVERLNIKSFALKDKIDPEYLVQNPKLSNIYSKDKPYPSLVIKKNNIQPVEKMFNEWAEEGKKTIIVHHRASAWIRSFNLGDVIRTLKQYFETKGFKDYNILTFPRNFTQADHTFFTQMEENEPEFEQLNTFRMKTENLHQFFYAISKAACVISSDTAAFHYTEGIGNFGIGIYSSFPSRMRTKTYVNTHSYDIIFPDCEFVCDRNNYVGCVSHFKTPYEICTHVANKYKDILKSDHHFKRGNRVPDKAFIEDLDAFVKNVGLDSLTEQEIFQYAPCLSSRWNPVFVDQLLAIYENEHLLERLC